MIRWCEGSRTSTGLLLRVLPMDPWHFICHEPKIQREKETGPCRSLTARRVRDSVLHRFTEYSDITCALCAINASQDFKYWCQVNLELSQQNYAPSFDCHCWERCLSGSGYFLASTCCSLSFLAVPNPTCWEANPPSHICLWISMVAMLLLSTWSLRRSTKLSVLIIDSFYMHSVC